MSKKKEEAKAMLSAAEALSAAGEGIPQSAMPTAPFDKGANEGATVADGAEIFRGAQDDESLTQGGEDTSSTAGGDCPSSVSEADSFSPEGGSQSGTNINESKAKVRLIADKNGTVPEIKDGKILLRAAFGATVYANARRMIGCGVFVEIPAGYAGFILPSLRLRENWGLVCQGVRMPGESGEVSVTLINCGIRDCDIQPGEVIAEMVIVPCLEVEV